MTTTYVDTPAFKLTTDQVVLTTFNANGDVLQRQVLTPTTDVGSAVPLFPTESTLSMPVLLESIRSSAKALEANAATIGGIEKWINDRVNPAPSRS